MKIELKGINKSFGAQAVINQLSLSVNSGEMVAITGNSGSGKTTLINIIGLIEKADAGEVYYDNLLVCKESQKRQLLAEKIGFIFQNFGLVDNETVLDNLLLLKQLRRKNTKLKKDLIEAALEKVGLNNEFLKKKVYECSGGEQQRVAIAKLLIKDCKVILADEPTASLDSDNKSTVMTHLSEQNALGKTVVIVSHDKEVYNKCARIIEL